MRHVAGLTLACVLAAVLPWLRPSAAVASSMRETWPEEVPQGATTLPLTAVEQRAVAAFPGAVKRYQADHQLWLVRTAQGATRRLHGTAECLRASGWTVTQLPPWEDAEGRTWSAYAGARDSVELRLEERIRCEDGAVLPDVGAAFWHALVRPGTLTCTAVTRVTQVP
jgi:hypothetical protein